MPRQEEGNRMKRWKRSVKMMLTGLAAMIGCLGSLQNAHADGIHLPIDIMIDVGHGGIDSGTTYGSIEEKNINLQIAMKVYKMLKARGYNVLINRTGDYALSDDNEWLHSRSRHIRDLAQRKELAVEIVPQVLISLHVNWAKNRRESGPVILYQNRGQSYLLAHVLQQKLNGLYQSNETPRTGKTYYLLNRTESPAVIVEMGFLSNLSDRARLTNPKGQKEIADTICEAVREYLVLCGNLHDGEKRDAH